MKKYLFLLLFFALKSQAQTYKSVVCDSLTKQALPSASIRVKNTNLGTTTNADGRFSLSVKKGAFVVSYIGYLSKSVATNALPDTIFLSEDNLLNEVVVMPDSALRVLLRNAYNNISKNYPQQPTYLTGFYREVNESVDSSRFNYFSESVLKVYKPPYTQAGSGHQGQVQVLKTRKVIHPSYEKNGIRFYGGPYSPIDDDDVLKRSSFINPKYYKKYDYELEKITSYEGKPVYVIAFSFRDSVFNGKIYIDKANLAYIKFDIYRKLDKKEVSFTRIDYTETATFDRKDNLWYLKHYKYISNKKTKKELFKLTVEYVTTSIDQDSIKSFSYDDQFNYLGIISRQETKISNDFFDEYKNVLDQTQSLKNQVELAFKLNVIDSLKAANSVKKTDSTNTGNIAPTVTKQRKTNYLRKIIAPLHTEWNLSYTPIQSFDSDFAANSNDLFQNDWKISSSTKSKDLPLLLGINLSYQLNKRWSLLSQQSTSFRRFGNTSVKRKDFGIAYRFVLNRAKKPITFEPSIKYGSTEYGVSFGKNNNPMRGIVIDDKKFNSKSIEAGIFQKTEGLKIGISTSIYSKKARKVFLNLDYLYPIRTSDPYFQVREVGFFEWFPEEASINLDDSRLIIPNKSNLQLPQIKSNFWIGLSYRVGL